MNQFKNYLEYTRQKYSDFRYYSDKNSLELVGFLSHIQFEWIENSGGYAGVFLDKNISSDVCFFGFLEILGDFDLLFLEIRAFAEKNKCKKIIGPINLSLWNTYRFSDTPFTCEIPGEYENNPDIHKSLRASGFHVFEEYLTVYRDGENPFTHFVADSLVSIEARNSEQGLRSIYELSLKIFHTAVPIEYVEFLQYMKVYQQLYEHSNNIFILKYGGENIGFLSSLYSEDSFVIKTIGILPDYRKKGFGNMLLDYTFRYYFERGKYKSYGIYMRKTGDVMYMAGGEGTLYRQYFTYIYQI